MVRPVEKRRSHTGYYVLNLARSVAGSWLQWETEVVQMFQDSSLLIVLGVLVFSAVTLVMLVITLNTFHIVEFSDFENNKHLAISTPSYYSSLRKTEENLIARGELRPECRSKIIVKGILFYRRAQKRLHQETLKRKPKL